MKRFLVFLLLIVCCAPLACAQNAVITAPAGQALWSVDMSVPVGTTATISITQSNGVVTTGSISYQSGTFVTNDATLELDGDSKSVTYNIIPFTASPLYVDVWNADNSTKGVRILKMGYGLINGVYNDYATAEIEKYPITTFELSADSEVDIDYEFVSSTEASERLTAGDEQTWIDLLQDYLPMFWGIFQALIYWLKFLFVDNLILTVVLYLTGTMAVAANTSRNIFVFYKTWFRQQVAMFNFVANAFSITISIITQILSVVGGLVSSLVSRIL